MKKLTPLQIDYIYINMQDRAMIVSVTLGLVILARFIQILLAFSSTSTMIKSSSVFLPQTQSSAVTTTTVMV